MGKLSYPLDAELTGPDRVVLGFLQKDYERHKDTPAKSTPEAAEDSDDSGTKHTEFVVPSPEGMLLSVSASLVVWNRTEMTTAH
jgi:hypothetical protein